MIRVDGKQFNKALRLLTKVVPQKTVLASLYYAKYTAEDGVLSVTATNLDTFVTITLPCEGDGEGVFHVKDTAKIVRGAKQIELGENLIADGIESPVYGIDPDEFPVAPTIEGESIALNSEFHDGLAKALPYVSKDRLRPIFNALWLDGPNVIGTDTHRLYLRDTGLDFPTCAIRGDTAALFNKVLKQYSKEAALMIEDYNEATEIYSNKLRIGHVCLTAWDTTFITTVITKLVEWSELPDYKYLIAGYSTPKTVMRISGKVIRDAANRLCAKGKDSLLLFINKDGVRLTTGDAKMTIPAKTEGDHLDVDFNPQYFKDALATFKDREELTMEFFGERRPLIIRGDNELSLTLPQWSDK